MSFDTRAYVKIKQVLESVNSDFSDWTLFTGAFSVDNSYPIRGGREMTLLNRDTNHCICGHACGKRPPAEIGLFSEEDTERDSVLDTVHEREMKLVERCPNLTRSYEDASLIPYVMTNNKSKYFLLTAKNCKKHFDDTSNVKDKRTIIYTRTKDSAYTMCMPKTFDCRGLRSKIHSLADMRFKPENIIYFASFEEQTQTRLKFKITKSIDPYGFRDIRGMHKIITKKKFLSPILFKDADAYFFCRKIPITFEPGDLLCIKLNFMHSEEYRISLGEIEDYDIYKNKVVSVTPEEIESMRNALFSDTDSDSD